jgi:hypothetical protein
MGQLNSAPYTLKITRNTYLNTIIILNILNYFVIFIIIYAGYACKIILSEAKARQPKFTECLPNAFFILILQNPLMLISLSFFSQIKKYSIASIKVLAKDHLLTC